MQRYNATATTSHLVVSGLALVTVTLAADGVTLAQLYDDDGVTPKANPFTASSLGVFNFYAKNGRYNVRLSGGTPPISPAITIGDILLYDPLDELGVLPGQLVDIRAFGAKCDGVTDDTAAFRAALAALASPDGGTLLLPANSTILISDYVEVLSPNVEVRGGGRSTIIDQSSGTADVFRLNSNAGATFRDLAITNSATWVSGSAVLGAANADDLLLDNVYITNFGSAISLTSCARPHITESSVVGYNGGGTALTLVGVTDWLFDTSEVFAVDTVVNATAGSHRSTVNNLIATASTNHTGTAFVISASTDCTVNGVTIGGTDGFAFIGNVANASHRCTFSNMNVTTPTSIGNAFIFSGTNFIKLLNVALPGMTTSDATINGLEAFSCADLELDSVDGTGANSFFGLTGCTRFRAINCHWSGAVSNVGVITGGSTYWRIVSCNFHDNGQGVTIQPLATYGLMADTHVTGSSLHFGFGVELFGVKFCAIRNNTFINNGTTFNDGDGIHIENADATTFPDFNEITGNYCYQNGKDGIFGQLFGQSVIADNVCIANGRNGIVIAGGADVALHGNFCMENGQITAGSSGIGVVNSGGQGSDRAAITGNVCTRRARTGVPLGTQAYGIYVDVTTTNGIIDGNLASGNATANIQNNSGSMAVGTNQTT